MKCFYHDDMDGRASAAIVFQKICEQAPTFGYPYEPLPKDFIAMDYSKDFPLDEIREDDIVWIVDYHIEPAIMRKLLEKVQKVTWIDHHQTAIEKYKDWKGIIDGVRKSGEAACSLTWKYVRDNYHPREPEIVPLAIQLIADRDVWTWAFGKNTKYFYAGIQSYDTLPMSHIWRRAFGEDYTIINRKNHLLCEEMQQSIAFVNEVLDKGKSIEAYREQFYINYVKAVAFETEFENHDCLAMNAAMAGSETFGEEAINKYDILIPFFFNGKEYSISLYSKKIDVSEIAKRRGGGGHKGAAGFQCDALPFEMKK